MSLGLAPIIVQRLMEVIRAASRQGQAILLVEQQVRTALGLADRAYVLRRGKVVMSGIARNLLERIDEIESQYLSGQ
jgi:branched-chain amino acid transport system ATP-binding protein